MLLFVTLLYVYPLKVMFDSMFAEFGAVHWVFGSNAGRKRKEAVAAER